LLNMKDYAGGIHYLEPILQRYSAPRDFAPEGELQLLMGEYTAMLEDWEESAGYLSGAVNSINDRTLLGRTFFLYGQVLEQLGRPGEAIYAYQQVAGPLAGHGYIFWAEMKQADLHRRQGNLDQARAFYERLQKNSKYMEHRARIIYELARTLEMKGEYRQAEDYYRRLLYGNQQKISRDLQGKIYYQLGKIHSEPYGDYGAAAAYFDTSSTLQSQPGALMTDRQAADMAEGYGRYAELSQKVQRIDSLLWLSSQSKARQDSILAHTRQSRLRAAADQQREMEPLTFANQPDLGERMSKQSSVESEINGFLNYRSERQVAQTKAAFLSIWGDRPLADNWRRIEAVGPSAGRQGRNEAVPSVEDEDVLAAGSAQRGIKPEDIPRRPAEKRKLEQERVGLLYQSANILFLELNQPDNAKVLFHQVVDSKHPEWQPKAMYALYELFAGNSQADSSRYWAGRLADRFPQSKYAQLITEEKERAATVDSSGRLSTLRRQYQYITADTDSTEAAELRALALENRGSELASYIHFEAVKAFIRQAKSDSMASATIESDNLSHQGQDSSITFTYAGMQQIRRLLAEHDSLFANSPYRKNVQLLREELGHKTSRASMLPRCRDFGVELHIDPSMEAFLQGIEQPRAARGQHISGSIVYDFVVTVDGGIKSYKLVSPRTPLGFEEALEAGFERMLRFKPLEVENKVSRLRCRFAFQADQIGHH
ncbi:MAG TPA: tetratricopeptide repeat protein, partial [Fodinibius sp.]|nr:tetratricopeptide repeat protein [Fodinibius sp.]